MSNYGLCIDGICACGRAWLATTSPGLIADLRAHGDEEECTLMLWHESAGHCGQCGALVPLPAPPQRKGLKGYLTLLKRLHPS